MSVQPCRLTATELLQAFNSNQLTIEDYAKSLLQQIEARDAVVKAWAYLNPGQVLEQARALDKVPKAQRGPLHGIGVAIKDVIYTKGMPTQFNSPIYENDQPELDGASVKMLRHAGALILGKTTTTEFAASTIGTKTTNPLDPGRTPGGSSSGSGAAVADFQATLALGTQTGGSIVRPASFNGIYGMKPTWNAISREGQKIYSLDLDTLGFFGRSTEDLRLCADVFGLRDDEVPRSISDVRGLRVAFLKTMVWDHAGPGTQQAFETGKQLLQNAGAQIEEIAFPAEFAKLPDWHTCVLYNEGRVYFKPDYQIAKDKLSDFLKSHVEEVHGYSRKDYLDAHDGIGALRPRWDAIADRYDVVVVPSVPDEAPEGLQSTGSLIFNALWTALHVPAINIPAFSGQHGMPIGLTLTTARYKDQALLEVAKAVSAAWIKK